MDLSTRISEYVVPLLESKVQGSYTNRQFEDNKLKRTDELVNSAGENLGKNKVGINDE